MPAQTDSRKRGRVAPAGMEFRFRGNDVDARVRGLGMRERVFLPGVIFLAALLSGLRPHPARATTFVPMDEATLLRSSEAVLVGTVTAIESGVDADGVIYTYVHVQPERVIKGALLPEEEIVLREPGGRTEELEQRVYGAPEFWVGERSLLFLSRNPDGTLQTNSLAMGKYSVAVNAAGQATAVRDFGEGASVLIPATGGVVDAPRESQRLLPLLRRLRNLAHAERRVRDARRPLTPVPSELSTVTTRFQDAYTFLGSPPARWFEPDSGQPVTYLVDSTGDVALGIANSRAAADAGLSAWTNVATASLVLQDGGTTAPGAFNQCSINRIVFNDPNKEITDPVNCGGVLAMGGYCASSNSRVINNTTFNQITTGRLTFNNGWAGCALWTLCNVSEVMTHELGHTIGLGHSSDTTATMAAYAHFDSRCASLRSDDVAGVSFMYPMSGAPTATPTATAARTSTPTASRTPTGTPTRTPTPVPTVTPPATPTGTPTRTATQVPTPTPSWTPTAMPTRTPTAVPTVTPPATSTGTPTRTATPVPTATPIWTATAMPTRTPTAVPTVTPPATPTGTPTRTATPLPTATPSWTPTAMPTRTPTAAPTVTPSATSTGTPTRTATQVPTATPSWTPTAMPTRTSTAVPTVTPTATPAGIAGLIHYYSSPTLGVSGASVQLLNLTVGGGAAQTNATDLNGQFVFPGIGASDWQVQPSKAGATNSPVDVNDAVAVLEAVVDLRSLGAEQRLACDVSGDGAVDVNDAVLILQYVVALIPTFPVAEACKSEWLFIPEAAVVPNQQVTSPQVAATVCQPNGAIAYRPLAGQANNQNFCGVLFGDCLGRWRPGVGASAAARAPSQRTASIRIGQHPRRSGRRLLVPLTIADNLRGFSAQVQYDAVQLTAVGVRPSGRGTGALVQANLRTPGVVTVAVASTAALPRGETFLIEFAVKDGRAGATSVRVQDAAAVR